MARARKICSAPNCPNLAPCPDHAPEPWAGSQRTQRLRTRSGSRQQKLRRFVLNRDGFRCHVCGQIFDEAELVNDHVVPLSEGGADHVSNMAPCCIDCHTKKTEAEASRGRARREA